MAFDFLTEPLVEVAGTDGPRCVSLPGLFAAWSMGADITLAGVRRHQKAAIHMFLVQVAVASMDIAGDGQGSTVDEETWAQRLLALAPHEAWHLVQEDDSKPALLQAPLPPGHAAKFNREPHPDNLGILFSAKNHALKQDVIAGAGPWMWLATLIELQTMVGYGGRSNYGIIRMNGGLGSRPLAAVYPDMRDGARWLRDVTRCVTHLETISSASRTAFGVPEEGGTLAALWTRPWDGKSQIPLADLHPFFIEICRRIRLRMTAEGRIEAMVGNSDAARVAAPDELCGRTGDPWAPMNGTEKIMTVPADGWSLRRTRDLLLGTGDLVGSMLMQLEPGDRGDMFLHAAVVTGGQGKTEGFHELTMPIPGKIVGGLMSRLEGRQSLGKEAELMSADADTCSSALRRGLMTFLRGGVPPTDGKTDRKEIEPWAARYHAAVRDRFFPALWDGIADDPERTEWRRFLRNLAGSIYEEAAVSLPTRTEVFYRAHSVGRAIMSGGINKAFAAKNGAEQQEKVA